MMVAGPGDVLPPRLEWGVLSKSSDPVHYEEVLQGCSCHQAAIQRRAQVLHKVEPHGDGAERVEPRKHPGDLLVARMHELDVHVRPPVPDQRRVQALPVVSRHDEDLA